MVGRFSNTDASIAGVNGLSQTMNLFAACVTSAMMCAGMVPLQRLRFIFSATAF